MSYHRLKSVNFGRSRSGLSTVAWSLDGGSTWSTTGVSEAPSGSGIYKSTIPFPDGFSGSVDWKTGEGDATERFASEDIDPFTNLSPLQTSVDGIASTLSGYDQLIDSGTVDDPSPTATSFIGSSNLSSDSNLYRTLSVCFTSGELKSAKAVITSYNGDTKRFTFGTGFAKAPANGDGFTII